MSLQIASLNSGSNGNCYYIGNGKSAVLIDAGLSCRETERRMRQLGLSMLTVRAVFVSHEHHDHITGLPGLSKKYQLPIYGTAPTLTAANLPLDSAIVHHFAPHQPVDIDGMLVTAFPKWHDAADPHSFTVSGNGATVGVLTDIGQACENVTHYFAQCQAVFLEANYCENMLANSHYPASLKRRISGSKGHLSNTQALELFVRHRNPQLSHLLLAHLSKNNNRPELVESIFQEQAGHTQVAVASRYAASPVYHIQGNESATPRPLPQKRVQGSLF
jgi:phosphoribosyl 1,2-cyclic phosphodiesterase